MKKGIALLLSVALVCGMTACAKTEEPGKTTTETTAAVKEEPVQQTVPEPETRPQSKPAPKTNEKPEEDTVVRVAGLKGPTSMGMVKLMDDTDVGLAEGAYEFTLAGSADEITPKLIKGELDIAALPANLAAILHVNTQGAVKVAAVNTLGVLYIVTKGVEINSVKDLKGQTIIGSGKGSTPEYALNYILEENGLDPEKDVTIEWKSEHAEVVQTLAAHDTGIALLPQPFVTVAKGQVEGLEIGLDLTKEWEALDTDSELITGVMVVRTEFAENHPKALAAFLREYENSVNWVNENTDEAADLIDVKGIVKKEVAKAALPYCNIVCITGNDLAAILQGYLTVLYKANPDSVGGSLPGPDFYVK